MKRPILLILLTFLFYNLFAQNDTICILQLNDVYEIAPLENGRIGGMARVATVIQEKKSRYPTYVVLAGDFVSPSVIGTTKIDGERVSGAQMVDLMNKVGVDMVTFGNHEFDIPEKALQKRINESNFIWNSGNVFYQPNNGNRTSFEKIKNGDTVALPKYSIISPDNKLKIGIVSATINSNPQDWVYYDDYLHSIKQDYKKVRRESDVVFGLTHLALDEDIQVAKKLKHLKLIMGGHEHENNFITVRKTNIAKADANAKTVYQHLVWKDKRGKVQTASTLIHLDSTILLDPEITNVVKDWENRSYASFRAIGIEPDAVVYKTNRPLDGTEANIRFRQTNLGQVIADAMLSVSSGSDAAIFNSGSIRIDDKLDGVITQLDIIRTLPFGGKLVEADMKGSLLKRTLDESNRIKGLGGYLQLSGNFAQDKSGNWTINNSAIEDNKTYRIISLEYLFSGLEKKMEFLNDKNPEILNLKHFNDTGDIRGDIRLVVIKYLSELQNP